MGYDAALAWYRSGAGDCNQDSIATEKGLRRNFGSFAIAKGI
jgi:hypothetical protein